MAKQTVNIGTNANDGSGDPLRTAFDKLNDNFDEVYANNFVTTDRINSSAVNASKLDVTAAAGSGQDNYVLSYDHASGGFTWVEQFDGDITSIVAGDGLTGTSLDTDDATLNVNVDDSTIEIDTDVVQVKDNGIDHDQLADRYTAIQDISTTTGTINLDTSSYGVFNLTGNVGTATLNIQNMKTGQVIDVLLSGSDLSSAAITLSDDFTTSALNKVGSGELDTSATNHIQVICIDDTDSDAILNYTIGTYTSDTTP